MTGSSKAISAVPINLRVYSPHGELCVCVWGGGGGGVSRAIMFDT